MSRSSKDLEYSSGTPSQVQVLDERDLSMEKKLPDDSSDEAPDVLSEPSGVHDFPEGGLRAWLVVAGSAGALFCNFGYANAFGVYQEYYGSHILQDNSPSAISWIGSVQLFLLFASMLFGGPLFDKYGEKVVWPPVLLYLLSVFMTSLCTKLWQFMLCQGILGGLSSGFSMAACIAACGHYFQKKRGAAMGLAIAGSSIGGVIFPIALSKMLYNPSLGFGWTVRIAGFMMVAILLPSMAAIRARLPPRTGTLFLPHAFKEPLFVILVTSSTFMLLGLFTPFFYLPTYAVDHGMSPQLSSYLVSMLNGASFFGRIVPGILADKIGPLNMLFVAAACTGTLILCWQAITTSAGIIVFAVLYGFFSGAIISLNSFAVANVPKNPQNIGAYLGMSMAFSGITALIGPPINGALFSKYGGFSQSLDLSGVFVVAGACGILIARHFKGKGFWAKM